MRKVFTCIFIIFSFLTAENRPFEKGVNFYNSRAEGAVGYSVRPINIENAIKLVNQSICLPSSYNLEVDEIKRVFNVFIK